MKVVDAGHTYKLSCLDGEIEQQLQFVKRCGDNYPGNEEPPYPGATSQEVLRALIDRTKYVNAQRWHNSNDAALIHLRSALMAFEVRAAEIRGELNEFQTLVLNSPNWIEDLSTCARCGHIACGKHEVSP